MTLPNVACASCGTDNRADRRFCRQCGTVLGRGCPSCGIINEPGDRFCGNCGAGLGDAEIGAIESPASNGPAGGAAVPSTERRLVSVLFADLVGSTSFAQDRDPELIREVLSRYYETARTIVERYGGTVEKFIGDAIAATWGVPTAHEDDAERAVRAGLELVDAVAALDTGGLPTLIARAAVMTGEVAASVGATGEGYVSGDLMNSASRLQGAADPGAILVDDATVRSTDAAIAYERLADLEVRGRTQPIPASRAIRVVGGRRGAGRSARLEAPFVGRDAESRLLKELFHATVRDRRARLVSVTGIAGIGKSRLVWELEKYLDGLVESVAWHAGRSPAYGEGLAFWALAEMVRGRARIAESDDPTTVGAKLAETLATWLPDADERAWVEPRLAALLGVGDMPTGGTDELFAAWRTLFERIADTGPTVLLFEDLHWADDGLLEFIERLIGANRSRPILIVTLARPELLERRPTWGAGIRSLTRIDLGPIDAEAMELLLVGLAPGLPQDAIRAVRDRSEGVPLYAVETVRMLMDQGRLTESEGRYRLAGPIGDLAIPPSLTALLGARLDALPEVERSLVGHAAVLGQTFTVESLASVTGKDGESTTATLDQLVDRELLVRDENPRSPERGQYGFIQGLIREVAYGRLSRRDRSARHLAAAAYFETIPDSDLSGVVATHLLDAYRMADGADAESLGVRARSALIGAAMRARDLHAWRRAISYLEDAADTLGSGDERMSILELLVETGELGTTDPGRLEPISREVLAWRRQIGGPADIARAERRLATNVLFLGRTMESVGLLRDAWDRLRDDPTPEVLRLGAELARCHLMAGEPEPATAVIEEILPIAERLGVDEVIAELLASKMWALVSVHRTVEAAVIGRGNLVFAERGHHLNALFRTSMNLSANLADSDPNESFAVARDGLELARRLGYDEWAVSLAGNAADSAFQTGDWAAVEAIARVYDPEQSENLFGASILEIASRVEAYRGRPVEAQRMLDRASEVVGDVDDPQSNIILITGRLHGIYAAGTGAGIDETLARLDAADAGAFGADVALRTLAARVLAAAGHVERARDQLAKTQQGPDARERSLADAELAAVGAAVRAAAGIEPATAAHQMDAAADRFRVGGAIFSLGLVRLDRAIFAREILGADEAAAEARAIFETLGARALLDRLDAAGWPTTPADSVLDDAAGSATPAPEVASPSA